MLILYYDCKDGTTRSLNGVGCVKGRVDNYCVLCNTALVNQVVLNSLSTCSGKVIVVRLRTGLAVSGTKYIYIYSTIYVLSKLVKS